MLAAASKVEMGVLSKNKGPGWDGEGGDLTRRVFRLKTVRDDPVLLEITREPPGSAAIDPHVAGPVLMRAKVGLFGDREREELLLRAVGSRLHQLKGREWYPLD